MITLRIRWGLLLAVALGLTAASTVASSDEVLKVAVGAPNNWDSGLPDVGQRAGIFKRHGLMLEILYTNGGGETMQAVISGSADLGISAGTAGAFGAFAERAPGPRLFAGPPPAANPSSDPP